MANYYIVMDRDTAWGVGETKEQAIQDAARRFTKQYGRREVLLADMEKLTKRNYETELYVKSRRDVEMRRASFYLEPISLLEWDDTLVDISLYDHALLAWAQQGYNNFVKRTTA